MPNQFQEQSHTGQSIITPSTEKLGDVLDHNRHA